MDISNLSEGMEIKNYVQLCNLINISPTKGKGRNYQFQELSQYCEYHKDGQKIIIDKIYKTPAKRENKRSISKNAYTPHMIIILLDYLASKKYSDRHNLIEMKSIEIALLTGMCNDDYLNKTFEEIKEEHPGISLFDRNNFYRRASSKINRTIDQLMNDLEKNYGITKKKGYKIKIKDDDGFYWKRATEKEEIDINAMKQEALFRMKDEKTGAIPRMSTIVLQFRMKEFYKILNVLLKKEYDWDGIYSTYFIGFNEKLEEITERYRKTLPEIIEQKTSLNDKILDFLDNDAKRVYNLRQEKYIGEPSTVRTKKKDEFYLQEDYIDNQEILSSKLIKLKNKENDNPSGV